MRLLISLLLTSTLCGFATVASAGPAQPQNGPQLTVISNPSGADVEVNGIWVGKTPVTFFTGPPGGTLRVTVKREGFQAWSGQTLSAPGQNSLNAELKPVKASAEERKVSPPYVVSPPPARPTARDDNQVLTNADIIRMVKSQLPTDIIIGRISQSGNNFQLDTDGLIGLKQAGVADEIIRAMTTPGVRAQEAATMPGRTAVPSPQAEEPLILHDGTPLKLRLGRNLSSADSKIGETVDFEVLEDIKVGDVLLVARGGVALATVTEAVPKRRMARGGKLNVNIDSVRLVNGDKIALRAIKETSGGGHTGAMTGGIVATSIVFFPAAPFFLFMHGKDVSIPKGTEITAYVNGEIRLDRVKFKQTR